MTDATRLRIGFIPLVDAAALLVAVEKGFAAAEGLDVELVREVSWANIRDKLAIGLFDAAHLLSPMALASSLGLGHVRAPLVAPLIMATNGNAITVSPALHAELAAGGAIGDPAASARAFAAVVEQRKRDGREPLTFGMTFPFSMHNYQLRYWLAEGGLDPDEDVRLVVLPPPYMVENLARGQLDGFCVGAPWSSVAVEAGVGVILHFGCDIFRRAPEKVLALRESAVEKTPDVAAALIRAVVKGAAHLEDADGRDEAARIMARPEFVGVDAAMIRRVLDGRLRVDALTERLAENYLVVGGRDAMRPQPWQAEWIYAQMLRWRQARHSPSLASEAKHVWRPDLYDVAVGGAAAPGDIGAFAGAPLDSRDIAAYLASFAIGQRI
ncbi:CmpA/NrtA family ABC transporter substrate-binding protein [Methylosinus sp. Sm6]|uniref:CmpA/NrtA family ABC transporter substrate-binding protein n=1 Tax=Methylosinus sp. Sm6 TaxID=2866948 RepID=UPI001C995CF8|nr:CmpA/NrtA family ABC transporter substrate-binding protein [Methylosinus sp. Sm6]MBY6242307.1 ABC transporter substrate-binding protein [Methylosinus sp. Sm6]